MYNYIKLCILHKLIKITFYFINIVEHLTARKSQILVPVEQWGLSVWGLHVPCVSLGFPHSPKSTSELATVQYEYNMSRYRCRGLNET